MQNQKSAIEISSERSLITDKCCEPFLKWAGGKRWLVRRSAKLFPRHCNRYSEPFLGSAAVFFALQPKISLLSDANVSLINCYGVVKKYPNTVEQRLKQLQLKHSKEFYYSMRSRVFEAELDRAVQFIYLNRVCWNGLYRVNRMGVFNVPIGTKTNVSMSSDNFVASSNILESAKIYVSDFEEAIDNAKRGDFLFIDPPYTVKHNNNGFVKYNETIFSWNDQIRLRASLDRASSKDAKIVISNANHPSITELYADFGNLIEVPRRSIISGKTSGRALSTELLIRNFQ